MTRQATNIAAILPSPDEDDVYLIEFGPGGIIAAGIERPGKRGAL